MGAQQTLPFLAWFIPEEYKRKTKSLRLFKAQMLVMAILTTILLSIVLFAISIVLTGFNNQMIVIGGGLALMTITFSLLALSHFRKSASFYLSSNFFALGVFISIVFSIYISGGIFNSSISPLLPALPLVVYIICDMFWCVFWTAIVTFTSIGFLIEDTLGFSFPDLLPIYDRLDLFLIHTSVSLFIFLVSIYTYHKTQNRVQLAE